MPDPMSAKNMISPAHYQEFAQPYQKTLITKIKALELPTVLHICGNTKDRWLEMADTGAIALSLDQVVDFTEVRVVVGSNIILTGNVDPINALLRGEPAKVELEARQSIEKGGPQKFVLAPGCGVPPGTPVQNLKAMVEVARAFPLFDTVS